MRARPCRGSTGVLAAVVATALLGACAPGEAFGQRATVRAAPTPHARIEVVEVNGAGETHRVQLVVATGDGQGPSRLEVRGPGGASYRVDLEREDLEGDRAAVRIDLRRQVRNEGVEGSTELHLAQVVPLRRQVLLGQVEGADGHELRVLVTLL